MRESSLRSLDLCGAACTAALLVGGVWYAFFRPSAALHESTRLRSELETRHRDLGLLQREYAAFQERTQSRESELTEAGVPPARSPIENDLRTLSELMRQNNLHVAEVNPGKEQAYPGVLESRYHLRAAGQYPAIVQLLRQFEACAFWGDITHLDVRNTAGPRAAEADLRILDLTVSFYSATEPAPASPSGGET